MEEISTALAVAVTAIFLVCLVYFLVVLVVFLLRKFLYEADKQPPDKLVSLTLTLAIVAPIVAICSLLAGIYYLMYSAIAASIVFSVVCWLLPQDLKKQVGERLLVASIKARPNSVLSSEAFKQLPQDLKKKIESERIKAAIMKAQPKNSARGTVAETGQVLCPQCSSSQVQALKHGFSGLKAIGGAAVVGPVGLLAGLHGAGKIKVACLACGHTWKPGA